jgi:glycolate oxidase FAD binding subunit
MVATALAGPLRLRYGSPRDLLLGLTVVRPDGVVAKSGGKVVKNVAGYDLGKLFTGSHGTLGVITEATFRLHPLPKAVAYVTGVCTDTGLGAAVTVSAIVGAAVSCRWQPSAIEVGPGLSVSIALEGTPDGVAERAQAITRIPRLGGLEQITISPNPPSWWGQLPAPEDGGPATPVVRVTFWRTKLLDLLNLIGKSGVRCGVGGSAGAGLLYLTGTRDEEFLGQLRALLAGRGSVTVLTDPPAFGHPLMRAVRDQFDPARRMRGAG